MNINKWNTNDPTSNVSLYFTFIVFYSLKNCNLTFVELGIYIKCRGLGIVMFVLFECLFFFGYKVENENMKYPINDERATTKIKTL